jgi:hypothetical protein
LCRTFDNHQLDALGSGRTVNQKINSKNWRAEQNEKKSSGVSGNRDLASRAFFADRRGKVLAFAVFDYCLVRSARALSPPEKPESRTAQSATG